MTSPDAPLDSAPKRGFKARRDFRAALRAKTDQAREIADRHVAKLSELGERLQAAADLDAVSWYQEVDAIQSEFMAAASQTKLDADRLMSTFDNPQRYADRCRDVRRGRQVSLKAPAWCVAESL